MRTMKRFDKSFSRTCTWLVKPDIRKPAVFQSVTEIDGYDMDLVFFYFLK